MASRRTGNAFSALDGREELVEAHQERYGEFADVDSGRQVAEAIGLYKIVPDLKQPRRVVPGIVRESVANWQDRRQWARLILSSWIEQAGKECRQRNVKGLNWVRLLDPKNEDPDGEIGDRSDYGPVAWSLIRVAALARSIRDDGLINPITAYRDGEGYVIDTGERRWWAFALLDENQAEGFDRIPCRVVEGPDPWRQAVENNQRNDLNAIGRARQLALLLMDLYGQEDEAFSYEFASYEDCESDQAFYAQVADGTKFRVPRGEGERLCEAMGVRGTAQIRLYRRLLRMPEEMWNEADEYDWSAAEIVDRLRIAEDREKRLRSGYTVNKITVSPEEETEEGQSPAGEDTEDVPKFKVGDLVQNEKGWAFAIAEIRWSDIFQEYCYSSEKGTWLRERQLVLVEESQNEDSEGGMFRRGRWWLAKDGQRLLGKREGSLVVYQAVELINEKGMQKYFGRDKDGNLLWCNGLEGRTWDVVGNEKYYRDWMDPWVEAYLLIHPEPLSAYAMEKALAEPVQQTLEEVKTPSGAKAGTGGRVFLKGTGWVEAAGSEAEQELEYLTQEELEAQMERDGVGGVTRKLIRVHDEDMRDLPDWARQISTQMIYMERAYPESFNNERLLDVHDWLGEVIGELEEYQYAVGQEIERREDVGE